VNREIEEKNNGRTVVVAGRRKKKGKVENGTCAALAGGGKEKMLRKELKILQGKTTICVKREIWRKSGRGRQDYGLSSVKESSKTRRGGHSVTKRNGKTEQRGTLVSRGSA